MKSELLATAARVPDTPCSGSAGRGVAKPSSDRMAPRSLPGHRHASGEHSGPACSTETLTCTLQEASRLSGLSVSTLRCHHRRGALKCPRVGGRRLVDAESLLCLLHGDSA